MAIKQIAFNTGDKVLNINPWGLSHRAVFLNINAWSISFFDKTMLFQAQNIARSSWFLSRSPWLLFRSPRLLFRSHQGNNKLMKFQHFHPQFLPESPQSLPIFQWGLSHRAEYLSKVCPTSLSVKFQKLETA